MSKETTCMSSYQSKVRPNNGACSIWSQWFSCGDIIPIIKRYGA